MFFFGFQMELKEQIEKEKMLIKDLPFFAYIAVNLIQFYYFYNINYCVLHIVFLLNFLDLLDPYPFVFLFYLLFKFAVLYYHWFVFYKCSIERLQDFFRSFFTCKCCISFKKCQIDLFNTYF